MINYRVKVRDTGVYIWGSEGIVKDPDSPFSLYLYFRVDETGEEVTIHARKKDGSKSEIGAIKAGECFTVKLEGFSGIHARCSSGPDCYMDCAILSF